jgi:diguanylate cyclase (GGDEF)-like protein/PAS domain S-box-containing protein
MSDRFISAGVTTRASGLKPAILTAIIVFVIAAVASAWLVRLSEQQRLLEHRADHTNQAVQHAQAIQRQTERALSATYALAALVRQGKGNVPDFTATATAMLPYYPGAASLQLAPGGIVQQIVPLAGNEKAIGHNLLLDPARDKEAFRARDTGQLTLAGPFNLIQGGLGAVGRLPVFLDDSAGQSVFWGFTTVLIRFPEALRDARLTELDKQGFGYELWRIHPDTGQKQTIAASSATALIDPVTQTLDMPNGSWQLSIAPLKGWGDPLELALKSALGLLFSVMLAYLAKLLVELKAYQHHLEELVAQRTAEIGTTQAKLQATFDVMPDLVWLKDANGVYLDCNPMFERFIGAKKADILGKTDYDFVDKEQANFFREHDRKAIAANQASSNEEWLTFADDGRHGLFETVKTPMRDTQGQLVGVLGIAHDITQHRAAVAKIERLTQLYAALSLCNQAILHCTNETELFARVCRDVVQFGGLKMAWVGEVNAVSRQVIPIARFGEGVDYLDDIRISIDADNPHGLGPAGTAIREKHPVWNHDFLNDPLTAPWHERAAQFGWGAMAALPLLRKDVVIGTFNVYAGEANTFDAQDVRNLLTEMASDISYALDGFDREARRKQAEENLKLAASVFTHAREAIMITAADGSIIDVNDAFSRITGYSRDEVLGQNPRLLKSGRQSKEHYATMWRELIEKGHWYGEIWNRRKNGEVFAEMQAISTVHDAQGNIQQYVSLFSDITELKEHESQLERIAHFDALTSLPNRVLLADRLHQGMAQTQRRGQLLAVAFLDLDGFKAINDRHGHSAGDQLLIALADHMKQALREGDTLARLGGDEFVVVLLDLADIEASVPMLNRLLAAAAAPIQVGDYLLQVSASLGVTFYPQTEEVDADQLLRQADQAMYQAKLAGKNRYHVFDAAQDRSLRGHHEHLERIRQALGAHEFVLYYQPKVNMRSGQVIGAEALIRWQHPQQGLLSPAMFLPVIEDHPLAIELGEWVIDTALTQITLWQSLGLDLPVSVNVGAYQLQEANFAARLGELLAAHPQVRPGKLELEVLETSALEDVVGVSRVIDACREIGVMFALDDFGTGYSSLTYLKRLPVTQLKIDQSFVRDMLDDPDDLAILEGVIGLAAAFRRQVIAEGVETVEHGAMLLQLGCDLAQGYGIAHPMPAQALPGWLAAWRPDPAWNKLPLLNRDDLPVLYAAVDHRAWISAIEHHLKDEREAPQLDHKLCRFGVWLGTQELARQGATPALHAVESLHQRVHVLAAELCELKSGGRRLEALKGLTELHDLQDQILAYLKVMRQEHRP